MKTLAWAALAAILCSAPVLAGPLDDDAAPASVTVKASQRAVIGSILRASLEQSYSPDLEHPPTDYLVAVQRDRYLTLDQLIFVVAPVGSDSIYVTGTAVRVVRHNDGPPEVQPGDRLARAPLHAVLDAVKAEAARTR